MVSSVMQYGKGLQRKSPPNFGGLLKYFALLKSEDYFFLAAFFLGAAFFFGAAFFLGAAFFFGAAFFAAFFFVAIF